MMYLFFIIFDSCLSLFHIFFVHKINFLQFYTIFDTLCILINYG